MPSFALVAYLIAAVVAIGEAFLLAFQTWEYRRFSESRALRPHLANHGGRVSVISPCKGLDLTLAENLAALFQQDYPNYELVFVVESRADPALPLIETLRATYPHRESRVVIAGLASTCAQKIHNLRAGAAMVGPACEILAFVDSDTRPRTNWLRELVQQLWPGGCSAATSYRWFVPLRDTWPNLMLASLDHALAPFGGPGLHHLVWGGSWAIRREVYAAIRLDDAWEFALSDDLVASRLLADSGTRVVFEPTAILASPIDIAWSEMFRFVRRQYSVVRWHEHGWWLAGVCLTSAAQSFFWGSLLAAIYGFVVGASWAPLPAAAIMAIYAFHIYRAWLRQTAADSYVGQWRKRLRIARRFDLLLHPLSAGLNAMALLSSAWGRGIVWRGVHYRRRTKGAIEIRRSATPLPAIEPIDDGPDLPRPHADFGRRQTSREANTTTIQQRIT